MMLLSGKPQMLMSLAHQLAWILLELPLLPKHLISQVVQEHLYLTPRVYPRPQVGIKQ